MINSENLLFDWKEHLRFPAEEEIKESNGGAFSRSPYLAGWVQCGDVGLYDGIEIEMRADHLPSGTYCSAANFYLDYSSLEKKYKKVYTEAIGGYCGLQHNLEEGKYNAILSFWDIFCEDEKGNRTVIRPKRIYPEKTLDSDDFSGEGTGAKAIVAYTWAPGVWYRVKAAISALENGNSAVALTIGGEEDKEETLIAKFDLGFSGAAFKGNFAFFLENFDPATAGEVRTMAVRRARVHPIGGDVFTARGASCYSAFKNYRGSYDYFAADGAIGLITTGVPGCAPKKERETLPF